MTKEKKEKLPSVKEMVDQKMRGPDIVQELMIRKLDTQSIISLLKDHGHLAHTDPEKKDKILVSIQPYKGEVHPRMSRVIKIISIYDAYDRYVRKG